MHLITPPFLKKGDTIGIAATARKISDSELNPAIQLIEQFQYKVKLSENIFSEYHQFAGTDEERAKGFQQLLDDEQVKAIFIARGGCGTVRVIDKINFESLKHRPKWICGFSDVTVLHSHLFQIGIKSIHSTMPLLFTQSEISTQKLFDILEGKNVEYTIPSHPLNKKVDTEGILVGGNLSVLYSLNNSVSQLNFNDKILFIEDVDEYLYHIDRMMMQMKRAGFLSRLKGLIVGGMTDMKDNNVPFGKAAEEIIYDAVKEYDYPVIFNFPAGHIKDNMPFIHGGDISVIQSSSEVIIRQKNN